MGNVGAYKYSGNYFSPNPNPLVHTWSLSVEEQIYVFLPLTLLLILRKRNSLKKTTASLLVFISVLSFILFLFPAISDLLYHRAGFEMASQFSFYSPLSRLWQFTVGGLVFLALDQYQNRIMKITKGISLLLVITLALMLFGPIEIGPKAGSIVVTLISVAIVINKSLDLLPEILISKLEWIGDRSYSIYLLHMPIAYIAKYSPLTHSGSGGNRILKLTVIVVASILLGALSYSKIENRYRDRDKRESAKSIGTLKVFAYVFICPLIMFLVISESAGITKTSMYSDRLDNHVCKFYTPQLDDDFHSRFENCFSKFGPATVVLGDSHAMNIYNSLFLKTKSKFFVGIASGGCRPNTELALCHYEDFNAFLKSQPDSILQVYFHQSGSYLISDKQGNVDTNLAFQSEDSYWVVDDDIQFLIRFLDQMGESVSTTWIGPFPELRVEPVWVQVKLNKVNPNPIVKKAFVDLEEKIAFHLENRDNRFRYASLIEILGDRQFKYKNGSCTIFRDIDHWSKCGEELFSSQIIKILENQ